MNLRLTILLVAALLIAVGTFLGLRYTGSEEVQEKNPWLFRIDENSIVYISVSHDGQTIEYAKSLGTEEWNILGEPEIPVYWPKFGGTPLLVSGPRVSRVLADKVDNPASFGLDPPETEVKVTDRSGNSLQFNLGNTTPDIDQQYAILVGDPALFTVPIEWAYVINRLADDPPYLRLFQLEDGALAAFQVISAGRAASYAKKVETGEWYIQGESEVPVQPDKWGDTPAIISGPRVDQVIAETLDNPEQFGLEPPLTAVRIIHSDGQTMEFHIGDPIGNGEYLYARVARRPVLYAMPKSRAQRIINLAIEPPYPPGADAGTPGSG